MRFSALLAGFVGSLLSTVVQAQSFEGFTVFASALPWALSSITVGPDGNLWFMEAGAIRRMTPSGAVIGQFPHPRHLQRPFLVLEGVPAAVGRMTPAGLFTEFQLSPSVDPAAITAGPDRAPPA